MPVSAQSFRGAARLAFDCVGGLTSVVERMHETIARHPLPWEDRAHEPTGAHGATAALVYQAVRGVNGVVRQGVDSSLQALTGSAGATPQESATESAVVCALNGICGDHLEASENPLAIRMGFRTPEQPVELSAGGVRQAFPQATPHLVVLVHGLCLSEGSWQGRDAPDIGARLRAAGAGTPVYLRYNTGRHISTNGRELADRLGRLVEAWPVPVESLTLIGHSMGGLVIRSACWVADQESQPWRQRVRRVVCLGTPHHGAPLEKLGHLVTAAMLATVYAGPLALGRRRSAGIKDLRFGNLLDEDWQGHDPDRLHPDSRRVVPLLEGVEYYFIAATVGRHERALSGHVLGDLLVRLGSATGSHAEVLRRVRVRPENCRVFPGLHHLDLLDHPAVHDQLMAWLCPVQGLLSDPGSAEQ